MNGAKRMWARFCKWIGRAPAEPTARIASQTGIVQGVDPPAPQEMSSIFERVGVIGPSAYIENSSDRLLALEFPFQRRTLLNIAPRSRYLLHSPVIERIPDPVERNKFRIREHDALRVANDMIDEYLRGIAYDRMTPDELQHCTLPFPSRAFVNLREEIGLRATRIDESNTTQA